MMMTRRENSRFGYNISFKKITNLLVRKIKTNMDQMVETICHFEKINREGAAIDSRYDLSTPPILF